VSAHPIVLVHGAWHGAWCWDKVVARLRERNIPVTAVELPFEGLDGDAAAARSAITDAGDGAIVVGHSYGGAVISAAASGLANVGHLVYLCAFMLAADDDIGTLMATHPSPLATSLRQAHGRTSVDPAAVEDVFYADCARPDIDMAVAKLRSVPHLALRTRHGPPPAWRDVPSTYVVCTDDRAILPALQRAMAVHATHVVEWPTSHSPFLSAPDRIVGLLAELAGGIA
jgi:pimeloyl-ACP methyl ester carboxylesterase